MVLIHSGIEYQRQQDFFHTNKDYYYVYLETLPNTETLSVGTKQNSGADAITLKSNTFAIPNVEIAIADSVPFEGWVTKLDKVYSIEVTQNAVKNALINAKINKCDNINFILGKVEDKIGFINDKIDTIIVDPARAGLDKKTIEVINNICPQRIIYVSCDTQSLANNLVDLTNYEIKKFYILDMFSYTYHIECFCILDRK